ncbi:MAG: recombinase family protein [Lachnospiraceae bacterium]|nr:recombinase family protein [Lachnospiraceae bacterium]
MSREYADSRFPGRVDRFLHYFDEDFTGANTNRPGLQKLLADIQAGLIDVLIVYQLDRLSRDVQDFANIYSMLEEHNVSFVSVKEQIDTTTPIGKAMMYVTVVFAQMERETIAQRVTDNMIGLAKKGYWVGGNPPVGFERQRITMDGKKHVVLVQDPEGAAYVTEIFRIFLNHNFSLQGMETYFKNQGIKTRNGKFFSTTQLHKILTMPYCVEGTAAVYDYYAAKGCIMDPDSPRDKWDGTKGVMVYGRTTEKNKKHQLQPPGQWRVCLGLHDPFIPADDWLAVQKRFSANVFDKAMKYDAPLLKGVLRCKCGSIMRVSYKKKVEGVSSWYYCLKRMRQGAEACPDSHHIKTDTLDKKVMEIFRSIDSDPGSINAYVTQKEEKAEDIFALKKLIGNAEKKIERLASSLALSQNSAAAKYIITEMEKLDAELQDLHHRELNIAAIDKEKHEREKNFQKRVEEIQELVERFDQFTASERNEIVRAVVSECIWDGQTLTLRI